MSGSSVAGAVVAGCCALILQWAVTDGNYPGIYSSQIKTYIISGAKTRPVIFILIGNGDMECLIYKVYLIGYNKHYT